MEFAILSWLWQNLHFFPCKLMKSTTFSHNKLTKLSVVLQWITEIFNFPMHHRQNLNFFSCSISKICIFFHSKLTKLASFSLSIGKIHDFFIPNWLNSCFLQTQSTIFVIFSFPIDKICDLSSSIIKNCYLLSPINKIHDLSMPNRWNWWFFVSDQQN